MADSENVLCSWGEVRVSKGDTFVTAQEGICGRWEVEEVLAERRFSCRFDPRGTPDVRCRNLDTHEVIHLRGDSVAGLLALERIGDYPLSEPKPRMQRYLFKCDIYSQRPHDIVLSGCFTAEVIAESPADAVVAGCERCTQTKGGGYIAMHPRVWTFSS